MRKLAAAALVCAVIGCKDKRPSTSPISVARVDLTAPGTTIAVGETMRVTAETKDASGNVLTNRTVAFASSNGGTATITDNGMVTGVAPGPVTISATSEGITGSLDMTVINSPVATIEVSPSNPTVFVGGTVQLSVTLRDARGVTVTGRSISFASSASSVAAVSANGLVSGVTVGNATITVTSEGKSATVEVTVSQVPVDRVVVAINTNALLVGQTTQATATAYDASNNVLPGRTPTWSTSDVNVANVASSGVVTGVGVGTATITATIEGKTGSAAVTVSQAPVATVSVDPSAYTTNPGLTQQLAVTLRDANGNVLTGRPISFATSDQSIATVTGGGLVTAVAKGTAVITVASEGRSATCIVTVQMPVHTITVSPTAATVPVNQNAQITVTLRDINGDVLTGRAITFNSSNPAIATVSGTGLVTGVTVGSAVITVFSEGKTATVNITVVSPVARVEVSPTSVTLLSGGHSADIFVTLYDAFNNVLSPTGRVINYSTSNSTIATAVPNGAGMGRIISGALGVSGTATVTVECEGKTATVTVTVTP